MEPGVAAPFFYFYVTHIFLFTHHPFIYLNPLFLPPLWERVEVWAMCVQHMIVFITVCTETRAAETRMKTQTAEASAYQCYSSGHTCPHGGNAQTYAHTNTGDVYLIFTWTSIWCVIICSFSSQWSGSAIATRVAVDRLVRRLPEVSGASARLDGAAGRASWVSGSGLNCVTCVWCRSV